MGHASVIVQSDRGAGWSPLRWRALTLVAMARGWVSRGVWGAGAGVGQSPKEAEECRRVTIMFIRLLDMECEPFDYSKVRPGPARPGPVQGVCVWQGGSRGGRACTGALARVFVHHLCEVCVGQVCDIGWGSVCELVSSVRTLEKYGSKVCEICGG